MEWNEEIDPLKKVLINALWMGDEKTVEGILHGGGCEVFEFDVDNAFIIAINQNNLTLIDLIMGRGPDLNVNNGFPLKRAAHIYNASMIRRFVDAGADVDAGNHAALREAIVRNDKDLIQYLLDNHANPFSMQLEGLYSLDYSCNKSGDETSIHFIESPLLNKSDRDKIRQRAVDSHSMKVIEFIDSIYGFQGDLIKNKAFKYASEYYE